MIRLQKYIRIQPKQLILDPPKSMYNREFWNVMKQMKHSIKYKNEHILSNITYIKTPYHYTYNGTQKDASNILNNLGKKSLILDKYKRTHIVQHIWYMDSNMYNTYMKKNNIMLVNRTWFFQDYDTHNSQYPTKLFHFLNIYPDSHQTDSLYDYLEELSDEIWFPVIQDYMEPKSEYTVRLRQ